MKGIVFTEFMEMVEEKFSFDVVDDIIESTDLPSKGIYVASGTYDFEELVVLVVALSERTGVRVPDLLQAYGEHLFNRFHSLYPKLFAEKHSAIEFLPAVDGYIHGEVRKLYPDAELPRFDCDVSDPNRLVMNYSSKRPLADFAKGLILGCITHFGEELDLDHQDLSGGEGTAARFTLSRRVA